MADVNPDGSQPGMARRAYNFAANGGGTVTYRLLVSAMSVVIVTMIGFMWDDLRGTLDDIRSTLNAHSASISQITASTAVHEQRLNQDDIARTAMWQSIRANSDKLADHEHRITVLESQQHWPRAH